MSRPHYSSLPPQDMLERRRRLADTDGCPRMAMATPDQLFEQLEARQHNLQRWVWRRRGRWLVHDGPSRRILFNDWIISISLSVSSFYPPSIPYSAPAGGRAVLGASQRDLHDTGSHEGPLPKSRVCTQGRRDDPRCGHRGAAAGGAAAGVSHHQ